MAGLLAAVLLLAGCAREPKDMRETYALTFRLAEVHPPEHPTAMAVAEFARIVEERSGGSIRIEVYDSEALGSEISVISQVRFGAIDFARVSTSPLAEIEPSLHVLLLPYLYEDGSHMWRVLNSAIGDSFLMSLEPYGLAGLTWFDAGARSFYTSKGPVKSLEDLKGLRIRAMESDLMLDMIRALGATGVAMPYSQVYKSLQTGMIDGAENNYPSYETSSHYEVAPYFTLDEHMRVPEMLIASSRVREQLTGEQWQLVMAAARESQLLQRQLWMEDAVAAATRLKEKGVEIVSAKDKEAFRQAVAPVIEKYGAGHEALIAEIRAMAAEVPDGELQPDNQ